MEDEREDALRRHYWRSVYTKRPKDDIYSKVADRETLISVHLAVSTPGCSRLSTALLAGARRVQKELTSPEAIARYVRHVVDALRKAQAQHLIDWGDVLAGETCSDFVEVTVDGAPTRLRQGGRWRSGRTRGGARARRPR